MPMRYSERTQVLLSPEQREKVERLAARTHRSVGAVIRDAIDAYRTPVPQEQRLAALERLFSIEAPVDDWEVMEAEILEGYLAGGGDDLDADGQVRQDVP
jgi:predicted transcriptional regulator